MRLPLSKQLTELKYIFEGYPGFIYSKDSSARLDGIPVFVYHTIEPDLFESHLQYLQNNNYKTLSIHEFYDIIVNKKEYKEGKSVLLTIDDARSSVWRFGYPLLKKYKMNAVLFVIPGITESGKVQRKNLHNLWEDNCSLEEIIKEDPDDNTLCSWSEIAEMYNSGFLNIELHTLYHGEVFKNSRVIDFITEGKQFIPYNFSGSPYYHHVEQNKRFNAEQYYGLPLFESAPLMLSGPKLNLSEKFINDCRDIFRKSDPGGLNWQKEIKTYIKNSLNDKSIIHLKEDSQKDVKEDLQTAREIVQQNLDSAAGNHLCLPWTIGNSRTVEILKKINVKSCFWGILKEKNINKPGDDPYYITRIKNDFIFRLPGEGRKNFLSIYNYKLKRRFQGDKVF